jgi:hypothetical protein
VQLDLLVLFDGVPRGRVASLVPDDWLNERRLGKRGGDCDRVRREGRARKEESRKQRRGLRRGRAMMIGRMIRKDT